MCAIDIVRNNKQRWNARVVYGDTDSLFVEMVGSDVDDAFRIGSEIAEKVTSAMKPPMKLLLEKVYLPCMLFAKKRYAGMKYEKRNAKPEFEAKGIETVRRDGCAVVRRILRRTLMALFTCGLQEKNDQIVPKSTLRRVRAEVEREWRDILSGNVSLRDLTFWKGVRLGTYKSMPPAAIVATEMLTRDSRARPLLKERVPYVVLAGSPGSTYKSLVVHPRTLLSFVRGRGFVRDVGGGRRINATYYILNATIPPLHRALILVGVDVMTWYREMYRVYDRQVALGQLLYRNSPQRHRRRASTIDHYVFSSPCLVCNTLSRDIFCESCVRDSTSKQVSVSIVTQRYRNVQRELHRALAFCARCSHVPRMSSDHDNQSTHCDSITCPVFHRRLNLFSDDLYNRIALDATLDW